MAFETYILFGVGLFLLIKGADYLVEGSASLGRKLRIPTIVIGLTIVAFGTSMPELIVNIIAALEGSTEVAFGNIIGSNIAKILLVLGITSLIVPIKVESSTVWKQIPFSILAVVVLFVVSNYLLIDNINIHSITKVAGIIFLCFFAIFLYYSYDLARKSKKQIDKDELSIITHSPLMITLMIIGGLVGLFIGGRWVVDGAIFMAQQIGLSEFLISATVIAIGTSLPELVTGIAAAKKTEPSIAIGNAVGSNIFNIFWILGVTAIIAPVIVPSFINVDIIILGFVSILLLVFLSSGTKYELQRWQGWFFLALYACYSIFLGIRG